MKPFPFNFKCAVCREKKSIYSSVGFVEETPDVRKRQRMCSKKCLATKAREIGSDGGISDFNSYY